MDKSGDAESSEAQVLRLQSQAGNRAVTSLLTGQNGPQVQRDISFTSKDLSKIEGFKFKPEGTYELICAKLDAYHASREKPDFQLTLVEEIKKLIEAWIQFFPAAPNDLQKAQKGLLENLQPEVQKELNILRAEVDYIKKLEIEGDQGGFHLGRDTRLNALSPARMLHSGKYEKEGGKGGKGAFAGTSKAARDLVATYGLTIAEIAATRIFSMPDYAYLNPSMMSTEEVPTKDPKVRIKKNVDEVGKMLAQSKDEYAKKQDPAVMAAEGAVHSAMMVRGLRKLPVIKGGELYRGMRLTPARFDEIFRAGPQQTSRPGFSSASVDPEVAKKYANGEGGDVFPKPTETVSVLCTITPKDARDISALSAAQKDEHEILFLPGAKFVIVAVDPFKGDLGYKGAPATEWYKVKMVEVPAAT